jgi:hypothetical protein
LPKIKKTAKEVAQVRVNVYKQIIENIQALRVVHTWLTDKR